MERFNSTRALLAGVLLSFCHSTSAPDNIRFTRDGCSRFMLSFPIHFSRKLSTFDTIVRKFFLQQTQMYSQSLQLFGNNFPTSLRSGIFLLVWSRLGIILMLFSWHRKSHSNFRTRFFWEFPCFQISRFLNFTFIHPGI